MDRLDVTESVGVVPRLELGRFVGVLRLDEVAPVWLGYRLRLEEMVGVGVARVVPATEGLGLSDTVSETVLLNGQVVAIGDGLRDPVTERVTAESVGLWLVVMLVVTVRPDADA